MRFQCDSNEIPNWTGLVSLGGPKTHFYKVGVLGVAYRDQSVHLLNQLLLLVVIKVHVPFGQPGLAGSVLDEYETDHSSSMESLK